MKSMNVVTRRFLLATCIAGAATNFSPAGAAEDSMTNSATAESGGTLEEVMVTGRFLDVGNRSALKLDASILDTPFSAQSYTDAFMKAIETTNMAELYSYMTGVQRGGNTGYDLSIRGFKTTQADKNAIMVDGLPGVPGRFGSPPTAGIDHIEVVKGPASVLYGQAQPGGFVNIISKKPKKTAAAVFDLRAQGYEGNELSLGDAAGYTGSADFTGPIDDDGDFLYRLIAEYADKDSFRDFAYEETTYVAPSLTWNISDATSATLQAEYRKRDSSYDNNLLVAPNKDARLIADITTRYQEPTDVQSEEGHSVSLSLTHAFDNEAQLNFGARHVRTEDDAAGFDNVAVLSDGVTLQRRARQQLNKRGYDFFDANLSIPFETGFLSHKLLVGASGGIDTTDFERIQFFNGPTSGPLSRPGPGSMNVDIYNPAYGLTPPLEAFPSGPVNRRYTKSTSYGIYLSDLLTLSEHWKATLGLRYAHEKQLSEERKTPPLTRAEKTGSEILPMVGLIYQPTRDWSIYASYSTSFVPAGATTQDATGVNSFDPESADQVEVGVKSELLDGRLTATLALFDIHKENTLAPIVCNTGVGGICSQQVGAERSKGGEFELNFSPLDNWQVLTGYAYTDATIDQSSSANSAPLAGARLTNSARNSAHVWSRYDFMTGALDGFGVGLGVYYLDTHTGSLPSRADRRVLLLPSYTVADLGLYYSLLGRYDFTLKIGNITDEVYYEGVNSTTNEIGVVPGTPRNVTLSVRIPLY